MFIDSRERGRVVGREREEREREVDVRETHHLVASCMHPDWGSNLQPTYVPWPGIKPSTFFGALDYTPTS